LAIPGKLLKEARKSRGKSQAVLAVIIGADQTYISKLEKDKIQGGIKGDELLKIARELKYDPYVFLGEMSFAEGDLGHRKRIDEVKALRETINRLEKKIKLPEKLDPIAERVMINQPLHDLVELIQFWDATMIRRFMDIAYGFVTGKQYSDDHARAKKEKVG